ncbi:hypothetical protein ZOSMA_41G01380 [Zostera marina]|uniref:Uncharacterized protein n=1 Tax=Zostera marina TaxID=29655 RepID=A0A0K9P2U1_ZOSMR|nr:hypothetical protein ZOSMA_41G01380 [Zostera marina]
MKFILDPPLLRRRRRNPLHCRRRRLLLRSNAGQGKSADIKWSMKRTRTKRRPLQSTLTELGEARFHDYLAHFLGSTSTVTNQQRTTDEQRGDGGGDLQKKKRSTVFRSDHVHDKLQENEVLENEASLGLIAFYKANLIKIDSPDPSYSFQLQWGDFSVAIEVSEERARSIDEENVLSEQMIAGQENEDKLLLQP